VSPRIPILNRGVDIYSLPLSTKEGFVLSRIDDVSSVEDISIMVGLKQNELLTMLDRLADLGAVKLSWRATSESAAAKKGSGTSEKPSPKTSAGNEPTGLKGEAHPAVQRVLAEPLTPLYMESEISLPGDLTDAHKRRLLNVFYGCEGKDYYALLGLTQSADKKEIRSAYFELSRLFHPDSMFGKDLGSFKAKTETVFKRLTEAYEVLGRGGRRKEYDEYLASTATTTAIQHTLDRVESQVRALSTAPPSQPAKPVAPEPARKTIPPVVSEETRRPSQVGPVPVRPPATNEERMAQARERLRRSFVGTPPVQPGAASSRPSAPPPKSPSVGRDSALRSLRQNLRQSGTSGGGVESVLAHLRKAKDAEQAGDLLSAAAALQAALALQPNHKDIQAQYERVSHAVARNLADNYEKQARYEEKQGKWGAAALSWERVSEGRPEDVEAARGAAEALLKATGDMHKAERFAQRAVDIAPNDPTNVVILARVLLAAGLRIRARRELEKAVKLDPQNEMIKHLLREAR
jgi:curved DNA-binding protein CbpA